ncbi:DUF257 family protein [Pyrococcus yayanosii]|nr:DUF257 family protein [Pyrococcus yayanosii]
MLPGQVGKIIMDKIRNGDVVLIEYPSTFPSHRLLWETLIPELAEGFDIVIDDFFGVGDLLFRAYIRRITAEEYKKIMDIVGSVKVVKIGPGKVSYGRLVEEIPLTYDVSEFIKLYYPSIRKVISKASKKVVFITVGLSEYLYFGGDKALQTILFSRSSLPIEDWTSIYLLNTSLVPAQALAALEEISPLIISSEPSGKVVIKKG